MITSRPVLNNVYLPQNKLLKRPNSLLQNGNNTLQERKKKKKTVHCYKLHTNCSKAVKSQGNTKKQRTKDDELGAWLLTTTSPLLLLVKVWVPKK